MSVSKKDLLVFALEEIKDECESKFPDCNRCSFCSMKIYEDDDRQGSYWVEECIFKDSNKPTDWKVYKIKE